VEVDIAAAQAVLNVDDIRRLIEKIFAGFQRALVMSVVPENEGLFTLNDSGVLQFSGDAARGVAGAQQDERLRGGLGGRQHSPGEPSDGSGDGNENEPDDLAHGNPSLKTATV
jgi:hypothetical protein